MNVVVANIEIRPEGRVHPEAKGPPQPFSEPLCRPKLLSCLSFSLDMDKTAIPSLKSKEASSD